MRRNRITDKKKKKKCANIVVQRLKKKKKTSTFDEKLKQQKTLNALWIEGIRNSTMSDV